VELGRVRVCGRSCVERCGDCFGSVCCVSVGFAFSERLGVIVGMTISSWFICSFGWGRLCAGASFEITARLATAAIKLVLRYVFFMVNPLVLGFLFQFMP